MKKGIDLIKKLWFKYHTFATYIFSAGFSFLLDLALFSLFLNIFDQKWANAIIIASFTARAISSFFNYLTNKYLVFQNKSQKKDSLYQYIALVIFNISVSSILVSSLAHILPFPVFIIKFFIECLIFVSNFFVQKLFIFNQNKNEDSLILKIILPLISFFAIFIKDNYEGLVFSYKITEYLAMIVVLPVLYFLYFKLFKKENEKLLNILSIIFTIFLLLGYSYATVGQANLIFHNELNMLASLIRVIGYYFLIKNILNTTYYYIKNAKFKEKKWKILKIIDKHPFIFSFLLLSFIYGIVLICFYPGIINYDNANQIKEVLGLHTRYLDSIIVLNDKVTLTNFNPIIHTLLLGNAFKLGLYFNNVNFGIFIYTFMQFIIVIATLSYTILFLHKEKVKNIYLLGILLFYLLIPYYHFYAITAVKDTLFTVAVILYLIKLYQFLKYDFTFKDHFLMIITMLLVILLRNNGIFLIILSFPFSIIFKRNLWPTILASTLGIMCIYIGYGKLLPALNIPNTSIREVLSIPFQQTARYVKFYDSEVTEKEKKAIDKVLNYDTLAKRYKPELSDKVKNEYNKYTTQEELMAYFKVWLEMFFKHPGVYIDATINNTYGYFYPRTYNWYLYNKLNEKLPEAGFDYHFNSLVLPQKLLRFASNNFPEIPILKLLVNCAFYTWIYLFLLVILIIEKKYKYIIMLLPAFSLILMNVAGPANTYFRYCLPYAMSMPLIMTLIIKEINIKFLRK